MSLTKAAVDKMVYSSDSGRADIRWDSEISGFGVRIYPSGKKSFVLSYRAMGRKHLMVLGQYGSVTLDQARKEAQIKIASVIQGEDPLLRKKSLNKQGTLKELCEVYFERHSKIHKRSWRQDERRIFQRILPGIGHIPLQSLMPSDIAQFHLKLGTEAKVEANRTVELLKAILEKGKLWGFLPNTAMNPVKGVTRFKETKRDRWLTPQELPRVAAAIAEEKNIYVKAAIWLYLLTGLRKSELLGAKWENVSIERGELKLVGTKAGNDHHVPLSSAAIQILSKLPREASNPYIIPGRKSGGQMVNISKPWNRVRAKAQVTDVTLHDLRRTVGSWMAQNGASLHLIGRVLNHKSNETTKIYARFGQDTLRTALESHGQAIGGNIALNEP